MEKIYTEFDWVLRITNSSTTYDHILTSDKLFECFLNKWENFISETDILKFKYYFKIIISEKNRLIL